MTLPKLLDPIGLAGKGPNNVRMLALARFGEVARALAEQTVNLLTPDTLDKTSLAEWRDAIAEEILLLRQVDPRRAEEIAEPLERSRPFRSGPELGRLLGLNGAAVVIPVDTGDPARQGSWLHLWLLQDPEGVVPQDDRGCLDGLERWLDGDEYRLFLVSAVAVPRAFSGRSWQFGSCLARRALLSPFRLDLAARWIISGEVQADRVLPVGIGNKINLPWKQTGRSWLLPAANLEALSEGEALRFTAFQREAAGRFFEAPTVDWAWTLVIGEDEQTIRWTEGSPFPGLVPYDIRVSVAPGREADYSKVFFGRKEALRKCRRLLGSAAERDCAFLLIAGDSGSGKSSLARAGLPAWLARPGVAPGFDTWRTVIFRPGNAPIASLAQALWAEIPELLGVSDVAQWEAAVRAEPAVAAACLGRVLDQRTGVLLVADQLEDVLVGEQLASVEVSGRTSGPDEKSVFFSVLNALARSGLAWVVATLRAAQLDALIRDETLRQLKEDGACYDMAPPDFDEIVRAPVLAAGLDFQRQNGRDLADILLQDLETQRGSDALPLLQMTLKQLFERRDSKLLTFAVYEQIGGLEGAIGHHADEVLRALERSARKELAPLLIALTRREPDGAYLSRPAARRSFETSADRQSLVRTLSDARLIVVGQGNELRVAHEALLRRWNVAADILKEHDSLLRVREELGPWVKVWLNSKEYLLPDGLLLAQAHSMLDSLRELLGSSEPLVAFVEASVQKSLSQRLAIRERLARDSQKVAGLLEQFKFAEAANELDRVVDYLRPETHPEIVELNANVDQRRQRVRRIADFYTAAQDAETLAGEEDFQGARRRCEDALRALGQDLDLSFAADDLKPAQIRVLKGAAYRARLFFGGLQLIPGIEVLFRRLSAGPARRMKFPFDVKRLAGLVPRPVWASIIKAGGVGPFLRLPGRQDNPAALVEFQKCLQTLEEVERIERARAAELNEPWQPSRTSCLVSQIAGVLSEFAAGPAGTRIDYGHWLLGVPSAERPEPVNAADYFFIGLFNYFIGKRNDDLLGKILSTLRGRFPDLDGEAPLGAAERLLRAATALEPEHFWPHWLLGRTLLAAEQSGSAELAFNAAIAVRPGYARGYEQRALAIAHQWRVSKHPRLRQRALLDSARARECADGDPSIFWPRGELLELLGDIKAAVDAFSRWLELEENIVGLIARKSGLVKLEQLAEELLGQTRKNHGTDLVADAHGLLALVHLTRSGWCEDTPGVASAASELSKKAWNEAAAARDLTSDHPHALTVQGVLLRQNGDFVTAAKILERGLAADAFAYRAALNRALAYEQQGEPSAAVGAWRDLETRSAQAGAEERELCPPWIQQRMEASRQRLRIGRTPEIEKTLRSTGTASPVPL